MVDLEKLKPILEGLTLDADTIDAIIGLDMPVEDTSELQSKIDQLNADVETAKGELESLNVSWQDRYKKAFFSGQVEDLHDEQNKEDNQETEGELFTPYVEKEEE